MPKPTLDADTILKRAAPVTGQHAHEIQPFGHLVRMPIALSEHARKESVDNLNQLLADTMALRDFTRNITGKLPAPRSISSISSSISTMTSRTRWSTPLPSAFN